MEYENTVFITTLKGAEAFKGITEVVGDVFISCSCDLPNLKTITGDLIVQLEAEVSCGELENVNGQLTLIYDACLCAPKLRSVNTLYASDSVLVANELEIIFFGSQVFNSNISANKCNNKLGS